MFGPLLRTSQSSMNSSTFATEGIVVSLFLFWLVWRALGQCRFAGKRLKQEREWLSSVDCVLTADQRLDAREARIALDSWLLETPNAKASVVVFSLARVLTGAEGIEADAVRGWINWPRYMAGVFVFVGLLGTVFSMSLALGKLGLTISDTSSTSDTAMTAQTGAHLLEGITGLLSGMESAFLCTLSGILATLIVSYANWRYLQACDRFDQELQWMVLRRLSLQQDAAALSAAASSLAMVSDTAFRLSTKLLDVSTQFEEEISSLSVVYERAGTVLDKVNGIPLEQYEDLSRSAEALADVAKQLNAERNHQEEGSETVQGAAARMERAVENLRDSLAKSQKASGDSLEKMVTQVQNTNAALGATVRRFEIALNDVASGVEAAPVRQEMAALRAALAAGQRATPTGQSIGPNQDHASFPSTATHSTVQAPMRPPIDVPMHSLPASPSAPHSAWQRVREWVGETTDRLKR